MAEMRETKSRFGIQIERRLKTASVGSGWTVHATLDPGDTSSLVRSALREARKQYPQYDFQAVYVEKKTDRRIKDW